MERSLQSIQIIKTALLNGQRLTTAEANRIGKTVDSRKIISVLREQGMDIKDYWNTVGGRRFKTYYCDKKPCPPGRAQPELF